MFSAVCSLSRLWWDGDEDEEISNLPLEEGGTTQLQPVVTAWDSRPSGARLRPFQEKTETCIFKDEIAWFLKFLAVNFKHIYIVQSLSHVWFFFTQWTVACQSPLSSTIFQNLLKFMSIELVMLFNHLIHPLLMVSFAFTVSQPSGSFLVHRRFTSGGQSIGASASVLLMNIQGWFPLVLTDWTFAVQRTLKSLNWKASILGAQPSSWSSSPIHIWLLENSFNYMDLGLQSDISAFKICCLGLS